MYESEYFLGLDIGTDSVGWAVTDPDYGIVRKKGKALWGVRLFDPAETAHDRRVFRTARRRIERRRQRLQWLQEIFADAIGKTDPAFFQRLRESKFLEEDKRADRPLGRYTLFADKSYCDKDFHKQFPTIYHLRKALMDSPGPFDARLVYLALHHILKNRGHFLYAGLSTQRASLEAGLKRLEEAVDDEFRERESQGFEKKAISPDGVDRLKEILISRPGSKQNRQKLIANLFSAGKNDVPYYAAAGLLAGRKISLDDLYGEEGAGGEDCGQISLEDDFSVIEEKLAAALGDRLELLLAVKGIYDWALLETMLSGEENLSSAKVRIYQKHREDLLRLKKALRSLGSGELRREILHGCGVANYRAYSGKDAGNSRCGYEEFKKYMKGRLAPFKESSEEIAAILDELERGEFLPKQTSRDNGVIPCQLHEAELVKILRNASGYLPFLNEKDESGLTKAEQIVEVFRFRVPYYVGPLGRSQYGWVVRSGEKIYPWNFEKVVDLEQSREKFITRMTAKCSYIGEDVLPKSSLVYTKFMALNELNNIKLNGKKLPAADRQRIYGELLMKGRKANAGSMRALLALDEKDELSGFDREIKASLAPWRHYGWLLDRQGGFEAAEEIIRRITLFGDDRKLLEKWIEKALGGMLSEEERKKALSFRCRGWGSLSGIFLTKILAAGPDGRQESSILDAMWDTGDNLMELLSAKYGFAEAVEKYREERSEERSISLREYLDESYASPSVKRAIHQTMEIACEIEKIMGGPPKRIFLEMARGDGEKGKRTIPRKEVLTSLYEKCKEESAPIFQSLKAQPEDALRRDKLYLYYTQLGKCMYSGDVIDLRDLDQGYDIDHIYPQSKIKDDAICNRVLVKRELNAAKGDSYPLPRDMRMKMRPFWAALKEQGLISREKYERLIRASDLTPEEKGSFISRQLVETRQSCKIAAELLRLHFGSGGGRETEIVYVKAGNVSSFRQDQRLTENGEQKQAWQCRREKTTQDPLFVKCREINAFHHAKDAYLNIVAGNVYYVKFTRDPANYIRNHDSEYSLNRIFGFNVSRNGETAWTAERDASISAVRRAMEKNNILFTRRAAEAKGGLFDQMIVPRGKGQAQAKGADPRMSVEKYGGYNKKTGAYFALVEHRKGKKTVRTIAPVYLMDKAAYERDPENYCRTALGLEDPRVLIPRIKINALVSYGPFRMHVSGRTGNQLIMKNANQLVLAPKYHKWVKDISKYVERCKAAKRTVAVTEFDGICAEQNMELYRVLREKLGNSLYSVKLGVIAGHLENGEEKFKELSEAEQCRVILEILRLFENSAGGADLSPIGAPPHAGILTLSQNIVKTSGVCFKLIHQSVTGFFEHETDLLAEGPR